LFIVLISSNIELLSLLTNLSKGSKHINCPPNCLPTPLVGLFDVWVVEY
jgi:hypothetical protein